MRTIALAALLALSGCATLFTGLDQRIAVNTTPTGARCVFVREGQQIAAIESTPGVAKVRKSKHDIRITCTKDGYQPAEFYNKSGVNGVVFADIAGGLLLGGVGAIIDGSTGADNHYEDTVNVMLPPLSVRP